MALINFAFDIIIYNFNQITTEHNKNNSYERIKDSG